jgi:hypothetical protein
MEIVTRLHDDQGDAETSFTSDGKALALWQSSTTVTEIAADMREANLQDSPLTRRVQPPHAKHEDIIAGSPSMKTVMTFGESRRP